MFSTLTTATRQLPKTLVSNVFATTTRAISSNSLDQQAETAWRLARETAEKITSDVWEKVNKNQVSSVTVDGITMSAHPDHPRFNPRKHITTSLGGSASHGSSFEYLSNTPEEIKLLEQNRILRDYITAARDIAKEIPDNAWEKLREGEVKSLQIGNITFSKHPDDKEFAPGKDMHVSISRPQRWQEKVTAEATNSNGKEGASR